MTPDAYAAAFTADLQAWSHGSERSEQKRSGVIGASDFMCRERSRRTLARIPETNKPSKWAAFVGSALDKELKAARLASNPALLFDVEWTVTIAGYTFPVHPDEVDPSEPSVTDYKSKNGLAMVRGKFTDPADRLQRHLQYLAGVQAGVLPPEGIVRNIYVDRSGKDDTPHIEQEDFSTEVLEDAASFLADVLYAVNNDEPASQDKPRDWCRRFCAHYTGCRGAEIDTPLLHPDTSALVAAFYENHSLIAEAEQLESELKDALQGVDGTTPDGLVAVTTVVNAKNGPYTKFSVRQGAA